MYIYIHIYIHIPCLSSGQGTLRAAPRTLRKTCSAHHASCPACAARHARARTLMLTSLCLLEARVMLVSRKRSCT